jgi:DNA-binding NarL/FixJ family response regulator
MGDCITPHKWSIFEKNLFMGGKKVLAMVVDDHQIVCDAIVQLMESPSMHVYAAYSVEQALSICKAYSLSVALVDARLPPTSGIDLIKVMKKKYPTIKVVGISSYNEEATIAEFLMAGVVGFLSKTTLRKPKLDDCMAQVLNGQQFFSPEEFALKEKLFTTKKPPTTHLAIREREIALLISQGFSAKEIGDQLKLSKNTVDAYKKDLLAKTQTKSSAEMIAYLLRNGIL